MSFSSILGILVAIAVSIGTAKTASSNYKIFLDSHALLIVIGGTLAASLIGFSFSRMKILIVVFFSRIIGQEKDLKNVVKELVQLANGVRTSDEFLKGRASSIKHPFLKEAVQLIVEGGIEPRDLDELLLKRVNNTYKRFEEDAENLKTLAKFPPAFGLLGAVMGMISMMQNLGGADAMSKVGPSLAVALVATLYGIAVANFIFLPFGENVSRQNKKERNIRLMICDALKLIRLKKHPYLVEETCLSYLPPGDRSRRK